jgi:hypothetical protein
MYEGNVPTPAETRVKATVKAVASRHQVEANARWARCHSCHFCDIAGMVGRWGASKVAAETLGHLLRNLCTYTAAVIHISKISLL